MNSVVLFIPLVNLCSARENIMRKRELSYFVDLEKKA